MSPRASGPIHFRSCLEAAGGGGTWAAGVGSGGRSANWRDWFRWRNGWRGHRLASLSAENNVFILSGLDQCELLAVMDNRVQSDGKWTAYTPDRNGHSNLSDGSDVEELLLTDEQVIVATDWSRGDRKSTR